VLTPLVARRNGHVDTRMVLGRYGHMFEGARRQEAETMDRVFETAEIGRYQPRRDQDLKPSPALLRYRELLGERDVRLHPRVTIATADYRCAPSR
jgi:hypothetical protein